MTGHTGLFVAPVPGTTTGATAKDARLALAGLLAKNADGAVRVGVMADGLGPVVTGTAGMSYRIRKHVAVTKVSEANGPVLVPNDGDLLVSTDPSPGSNSRIDVIWVRQPHVTGDGGSETTVSPEYGVTRGATSAVPSKPAVPTGATELASVPVTAGTTATSGLTFTPGRWTAANGAPVPVRDQVERDAIGAFPGLQVLRLDVNGLVETYTSAGEWSDWTLLPLATGFTNNGAEPSVRVIGGVAYFRGRVARIPANGNFTGPATYPVVVAGGIPAWARPTVDDFFPVPGNSGTTPVIRALAKIDGSLEILIGSDPQGWASLAGIRYPVRLS